MSRHAYPLILFLATVQSVIAQADPDSIEPPLGYSLQIGDKTVRLTVDEPVQVNGTFTNPKVKLIPDEFREFNYAGISFQYPSYFAFEADVEEKALRNWSLNGKNCVIMVQHYNAKIALDDLVDALVERYGEKNTQVTDVTMKLAGQKVAGKKIRARVASTIIIQEMFPIASPNGATVLLLQDSPKEDGAASEERQLIEKRIVESFAIKKK
jgi:hypothetical protein